MNVCHLRCLLLAFLLPVFSLPIQASPFAHDSTGIAKFSKTGPPLLFMENRGQVLDQQGRPCADILFLVRANGMKVAISSTGITYQFEHPLGEAEDTNPAADGAMLPKDAFPEPSFVETDRLNMQLLGSNPHPQLILGAPHPYYENYLNVPTAPDGILGVRAYEKITFQNVYPGIDWVIYDQDGTLKYDFVIHPGADPSQIRMHYVGAKRTAMQADSSLIIESALGELHEHAPFCYQGGKEVHGAFKLQQDTISISLSGYDPAQSVVFDPGLSWATYYGGGGFEIGRATATDRSGNVYLAGYTNSNVGIAMSGYQNVVADVDAFLVKFDANGVRQWATYFGGPMREYGYAVSVSDSGHVFLAGSTASDTSIAHAGFQNTYGGGAWDAFLVKFDSAGSRLWATYYGGTCEEDGFGVATDSLGNSFLCGFTCSTTGIAAGGHQNTYGGGLHGGFLVKFDAAGQRVWGTYFNLAMHTLARGVAVGRGGSVFLVGQTGVGPVITTPAHQSTAGGSIDAFLVKFAATGVLQWVTYYGGSGYDVGWSVAEDLSGNVFLAGETTSFNAMAANGYQNTFGGVRDAFLAKFNAAGVRQWGTYCGGTGEEYGHAVCIDAIGYAYLAGQTASTNAIAINGFQNAYGGGATDAFLVRFSSSGTRDWGTYVGGPNADEGWATATDDLGAVYLAGTTGSTSGIALAGHQTTYGNGQSDAFLTNLVASDNLPPVANCANLFIAADGACQGTAAAAQFGMGSYDPDADSLSFTLSPAGPYSLGLTAVVLHVSDGEGHTVSCAASVTVLDSLAPSAICQPVTVQLDSSGNASITPNAIGGGSTDNCSGASLNLSVSTFTCVDVGPNMVTLTVTDASGNTSTCSSIVTVLAQPLTVGITSATTQCGYNVTCAGANDGAATASSILGCPPYTYLWSNGQTSPTVTGLGVGTYAVTVTDAAGATAVQSVTLSAPTPLQASAFFNSPCLGTTDGAIDLSVNGGNDCQGYSFAWSNGAVSEDLGNLSAGNYSVTVTDLAGCSQTLAQTIAFLALPQPVFVQSGNLLSSLQSWSSYQWFLNGWPIMGGNASTYTVALDGIYSLSVTDSNGCSGVSDSSFITGITRAQAQVPPIVFPNPADDKAFVQLVGNELGICSLRITDLRGRLLSQVQDWIPSNTFEIDLREFEAGIYMVEIVQNELRSTVKLVVQ